MGNFTEWTRRKALGPVWLDGTLLLSESSGLAWPLRINQAPAPPSLLMPSGVSVTQLTLPVEPTAPLTRLPFLGTMAWELDVESHHESFSRVEARRLPVRVFFGWWLSDVWRDAQSPGALAWRTSRPMPHGIVSGLALLDSEWVPHVDLDGADQAVIASGTPTAGQVKIEAAADLHYWTLTLPSGASWTEMTCHYPALMWAQVGLSHEISEVGRWALPVTVAEVL